MALQPITRVVLAVSLADKSTNLLEAVNAFVARTPFPLHLTR